MSPLLNTLLVFVLALNLFALGTSRITALIRAVTLQGILIGFMPLLSHGHAGVGTWLAVVVAVALKGGLIPTMLNRAMRDVQIKREVEPLVGFLPSMLLGAVATGLAPRLAQRRMARRSPRLVRIMPVPAFQRGRQRSGVC